MAKKILFFLLVSSTITLATNPCAQAATNKAKATILISPNLSNRRNFSPIDFLLRIVLNNYVWIFKNKY